MSNLKITNFKDFKSRWVLKSNLTSEFLHEYFNFFRDSLIELEDDGLITKYYIEYNLPSGLSDKSTIYKSDIPSDIHTKIESIFNNIEQKTSLSGKIKVNTISIHTKIFLPSSQFNDITDILTEVLSCVNFLKDNGKDLGFECNIKISTPESIKVELIKNL
jgi:hypothetical protein